MLARVVVVVLCVLARLNPSASIHFPRDRVQDGRRFLVFNSRWLDGECCT
jgi:hypothetical protein